MLQSELFIEKEDEMEEISKGRRKEEFTLRNTFKWMQELLNIL